MAVIETWIKKDIKKVVGVTPIGGNLFSQDNMGNLIGVELFDNGQPAVVSGTVSANVLRADHATVAVAGTLSGNKASVTLPQAAYAVPGVLSIVIKLTSGSTVTTIGAFQAVVYRSSTDTIVDPGTIIPSVQDLIDQIDAAVASIPPDYSELTEEVDDLKSAISYREGSTDITPTTLVDNNFIRATNQYLGSEIYNTNWKHTQAIDCTGLKYIEIDTPIMSEYQQGIVFYNGTTAVKGYLYNDVDATSGETHRIVRYEVPSGVDNFKASVRKSDISTFSVAGIKMITDIDTIKDDVEEISEKQAIDESDIKKLKPIYMKTHPVLPLLPEMCADFAWCGMRQSNAMQNKNVEITVSGTAGAYELTVTAISDGLSTADISSAFFTGGVLTEDGVSYKVYNFKYKTETTVEIYPALHKNVSGATLSNLMYDSNESYQGMHLTEHGYKAYMYYLFNSNPKHCETKKYIKTFNAYDSNVNTSPFTKYGGQIYQSFGTENRQLHFLQRYTKREYNFTFAASYTPYEQKTGLYWEVDLKKQSGYLELYLNAISNQLILPSGQEIYVDVYIDGTLTSHTVIGDAICKRIIVDYDSASTGKVDIYCNKMAPINGGAAGFSISRCTWWINTLEYETPIIPKNTAIGMEFDSWGVYHDSISAVALSSLHDAASGVSVPLTNHSLGSQTSAWGKAWFYENVQKYHPGISITDFVINDNNSTDAGYTPTTIVGPDDKVYSNIIDTAAYCENYRSIIDSAIYNNIQPIAMRACLHGYNQNIDYTIALIDSLASELT